MGKATEKRPLLCGPNSTTDTPTSSTSHREALALLITAVAFASSAFTIWVTDAQVLPRNWHGLLLGICLTSVAACIFYFPNEDRYSADPGEFGEDLDRLLQLLSMHNHHVPLDIAEAVKTADAILIGAAVEVGEEEASLKDLPKIKWPDIGSQARFKKWFAILGQFGFTDETGYDRYFAAAQAIIAARPQQTQQMPSKPVVEAPAEA